MQAKCYTRGIDRGEVGKDHLGEIVGFGSPLAFVVGKEKSAILNQRPAQSQAILILPLGRIAGAEDGCGVQSLVFSEIIEGAVKIVVAGLGDNVDEAPQRSSVLSQIAPVENTEFARRFERRRGARQAGEGWNIVKAVHLDQGVEFGLAAESQTADGRRADACI